MISNFTDSITGAKTGGKSSGEGDRAGGGGSGQGGGGLGDGVKKVLILWKCAFVSGFVIRTSIALDRKDDRFEGEALLWG